MVKIVLDLKCTRLKYILGKKNYNKVDPDIYWAQILKITFLSWKSLEFQNNFLLEYDLDPVFA